MNIPFGSKFTAKNFEDIIQNYWQSAKEMSPKEMIHFDLRQIEWIALEQITFLFGWFRYLIASGKKIRVHLPANNSEFRTHRQLINLWGKWKIYSFLNLLPETEKITDYFNVDASVNQIINKQLKKEQYDLDDLSDDITVVPFQHISTLGYGNVASIDDLVVNKIHKPLNLAKQVYDVLQQHTNVSANDNLILSKIVTNELFLNVLHHSYDTNSAEISECYFAISLKRKFTKENIIRSENAKRIFQRQKNTDESYAEAKSNILPFLAADAEKRMDFLLREVLPKSYEDERLPETLHFFKDHVRGEYPYRNEDYIEFSFLDFGQGIPVSLMQNYERDITGESRRQTLIDELNPLHSFQSLDTRILEYAFLLNSSRHPLDMEMQLEYEIPRGLYFLVDIVRRHRGLVIARSRTGKLAFDFSQDGRSVKDCVVYMQDDGQLTDLNGTQISIILPANQDFKSLQGPAGPPFVMPAQIIKREVFYYSLVDIVTGLKLPQTALDDVSLQDLYRALFNKINDFFREHRKSPALLIYDFAGLDIFPVKHKLLFYFASSPEVNKNTGVILLNFFDEDILADVRNSIRNKLRTSENANYIFKPIPVINNEEEIIWLGVQSEKDEEKLTELLRFEDHFIAKSDLLNADNYKSVFFDIDKHGNVTTKIPSQKDIRAIAEKYGKRI